MPWLSILAVAGGAAAGALCRWGLSNWLNPVFPTVPLGTLAANLAGGLLVGVLVEGFGRLGNVPMELRLMLVTGFLGALTTFSSFSAEMVFAMRQGHYLWAVAGMAAHLLGSLLMTALGMAITFWLMTGRAPT
ncbi:fluoride efflux transporter CrcB [Ectothiorhodospiraceae bacterium WFHF3C12]|nr:fluoride efflux transporter CrcB [Ectothiorhodospiraceae bacterium WFHF3C12]